MVFKDQVISYPQQDYDFALRGFGVSDIVFCVDFRCEGIDDDKNRYTFDVLFPVWNALKKNNIEIPCPHGGIKIKGKFPTA